MTPPKLSCLKLLRVPRSDRCKQPRPPFVQAAPHWGLGLRGPFDELFCGLGEVEVQAPEHAGPTPEWLRRAGVAS